MSEEIMIYVIFVVFRLWLVCCVYVYTRYTYLMLKHWKNPSYETNFKNYHKVMFIITFPAAIVVIITGLFFLLVEFLFLKNGGFREWLNKDWK